MDPQQATLAIVFDIAFYGRSVSIVEISIGEDGRPVPRSARLCPMCVEFRGDVPEVTHVEGCGCTPMEVVTG